MRQFYLKCMAVFIFVSIFSLHPNSVYADTYTYDEAGRLTAVTYAGGSTITYSYDLAGNILQRMMTVKMTLDDAIHVLQVMAGVEPSATVDQEADVSGDSQIGLEELIYILQKVSEIRP